MPPRSTQFLISATQQAAQRLTERAKRDGLLKFNERDHLQPAFNEALAAEAERWDSEAPEVNIDRKVALPLDFHKVGGLDNTLVWPDERVLIELKAGASLDACAWDLVKLAAALRAGAGDSAYLVAAAATASWPRAGAQVVPGRGVLAGAEFFSQADHEAGELRDRYASSWKRWDLDGRT